MRAERLQLTAGLLGVTLESTHGLGEAATTGLVDVDGAVASCSSRRASATCVRADSTARRHSSRAASDVPGAVLGLFERRARGTRACGTDAPPGGAEAVTGACHDEGLGVRGRQRQRGVPAAVDDDGARHEGVQHALDALRGAAQRTAAQRAHVTPERFTDRRRRGRARGDARQREHRAAVIAVLEGRQRDVRRRCRRRPRR